MSARDIMPWHSPLGGHTAVGQFPLKASETVLIGEPATVDANGLVAQCSTEPDSHQVAGICVTGGDTTASTGSVDWRTGNIITTNGLVSMVLMTPGQRFITPNLSLAGTTFSDTAPTQALVGKGGSLCLIGAVWGFDTSGATDDMIGTVVDILDNLKRPISESGVTLATTDTYYCVFEVNAGIAATDGNTADLA
jgi:hypothetical protein